MDTIPASQSKNVNDAIKRWQTELLDLTKSNRLLYFKPRSGALPLSYPDPAILFDGLVNKSQEFTFYRLPEDEAEEASTPDEQLALFLIDDQQSQEGSPSDAATVSTEILAPFKAADNPKWPIPWTSNTEDEISHLFTNRSLGLRDVVADGEPKKVEAALYKLYLRSRSALQEQGVNVLFVAFGLLDWTESTISSTRILSPLLLVPVRLERETALDPFRLVPLDEDVIVNPALARKLETDFHLRLGLPEIDVDASLSDLLTHLTGTVAARKDWRVRTEAYLGLFSFAKYAMYADLAANRGHLSEHPVIRAIAGEDDGLRDPILALPSAETLDREQRPIDTFQVLDADASQQEAIAAVKAGTDLVIQGPPGTGKSQTITNLIAECLAAGKTVLFVSEKITALRVVATRLAEAGLDEFCLEAHSQDINKATIVHDLARTLDAGVVRHADLPTLELEYIARLRQELNDYAQALHDTNNPLDRSAYAIHGEYARLIAAPTVIFAIPNAGELTPERIAILTQAVRQLVRVGEVLSDAERHSWRGATFTVFTPQLRSDLEHRFKRLSVAATALDEDQRKLRAVWGLPVERSLTAARWLEVFLNILDQRTPAPPEWFRSPSLKPAFSLAENHRRLSIDYHQRKSALLAQYSEAIFSLDLELPLHTFEESGLPGSAHVQADGALADRAIGYRAAIQTRVARFVAALDILQSVSAPLAAQLGLPAPITRADAARLRKILALVLTDPQPQSDWFDLARRLELEELIETALKQQQTVREGRAALGARFTDALYEIVNDDLQRQFEEDYTSWLRFLKGGYRRDLKRLQQAQREDTPLVYAGALSVIQQVRRVRLAEAWTIERRGVFVAGLGGYFSGLQTDWGAVQRAIETVKQIGVILGSQYWPQPLIQILCGQHGGPVALRADVAALEGALSEAEASWGALMEVLTLGQSSFASLRVEEIPSGELRAWLLKWINDLEPLWNSYDRVIALRREKETVVAFLIEEVREAIAIRSLEQQLLVASDELRTIFGPLFNGLTTDWDAVIASLQWAGRLIAHFPSSLPDAFIAVLSAGDAPHFSRRAQLPDLIRETDQLIEALRPGFEPAAYRIGQAFLADAPLLDVANWAAEKQDNLLGLEEWIDYKQVLADTRELGLAPFVEEIIRVRLPHDQWQDAFMRALYTAWLTWRHTEAPALARFRGSTHDEVIAQFQQLDRWQWQAASNRIAERLRQRRPVLPLNVPPRSEPGILRREATKKRRFRPLRQLFATLPTLLPALKPCMLMSPLSVAQLLGESATTFDVVVFDEASQILPADAIGAIGRARQAVIVGDQKQLPPTRFFGTSLSVAEDDDSEEELPESVLDACLAAGLPQKPLLWHYRSRHEGLIAFSNRHFYDSRLITFPSPNARTRAVEFVHVADGVYDRGSSKINRIEAARVVDLVVEHVRNHPTQTLGVIAFSEAQADAIEFEVTQRKRLEPDLEVLLNEADRQDGFFVKPLEKVQGDERDVIFFSVGYGPDLTGHMSMNFGPLNRQGGERRLNVAVTRARDRVVVAASFFPYQIDRSRTSAVGVHRLRNYLEYAEQGSVALLGEITAEGGDFESPFEEAVASALTAHGLRVVSQVGVSGFRIDLAIRDETSDRYILGIECDGRTYHSSKTARDRDRLRQQVLEQLGWRIHRIWSTDWIKDPQRETAAVLSAVQHVREDLASENLVNAQRSPPAKASTLIPSIVASPSPPATVAAREVAPLRLAAPYIEVDLGWQGGIEDFRTARMADLVALAVKIVETEGPVHEDRVTRALAACFGIARSGAQVRGRALSVIAQGVRIGILQQRDKFLWSGGMTEPPFRTSGPRSIQEIAPEEIAAGLTSHLQTAFALSRADLIIGVAREFGYDRTGSHVSAGIGRVIDALITDGILGDVGGQISRRG